MLGVLEQVLPVEPGFASLPSPCSVSASTGGSNSGSSSQNNSNNTTTTASGSAPFASSSFYLSRLPLDLGTHLRLSDSVALAEWRQDQKRGRGRGRGAGGGRAVAGHFGGAGAGAGYWWERLRHSAQGFKPPSLSGGGGGGGGAENGIGGAGVDCFGYNRGRLWRPSARAVVDHWVSNPAAAAAVAAAADGGGSDTATEAPSVV